MHDIFIAVRPRDNEAVEPLRLAFAELGRVVYVDHVNALPGDVMDTVAGVQAEASLTIAFITGACANEADAVDDEQRDAIARALTLSDEGRHRLVPLYHDVDAVPGAIRRALPRLARLESVFFPVIGDWRRVASLIVHGPVPSHLQYRQEVDDLKSKAISSGDSTAVADYFKGKDGFRAHSMLRAGYALGRDKQYILQEAAVVGPLSTVWRARGRVDGATYAIKVLHPVWSRDEIQVRRFERAAGVLRDHGGRAAHIVQLLDGPRRDAGVGVHYFVMPWHSTTLAKAVREGRVGPDQLEDLIVQVSQALSVVHADGIVHRDIKPDNILLDITPGHGASPDRHDFSVADFGSAFIDKSMSRAAGATLLYSAPETMTSDARPTRSADIFSFARVILFVLHGRELPAEVLQSPERFIGTLTPPIGARFIEVLRDALAWTPGERRHASVDDFARQALDAWSRDPLRRMTERDRKTHAELRTLVELLRARQVGAGHRVALSRTELKRVEPRLAQLREHAQLEAGEPSVDAIVERSRRRLKVVRALSFVGVVAVSATLGVIAWYTNLMAENRGHLDLDVRVFDLDDQGEPVSLPPGALPSLDLRLFTVGSPGALAPGEALAADTYHIEVIEGTDGATRRFRLDAPGGRYALAIFNRHRAGERPCPESVVWEVQLPGFPDRKTLGRPPSAEIEVPSCQSSRASGVAVDAGWTMVGHASNLERSQGREQPNSYGPHRVYLEGFQVDRWQASNADYRRFVSGVESIARPPLPRRPPVVGPRRNHPLAGRPEHPVSYLSWYDARDYCLWQGKSLMTFAQLQRVGRGLAVPGNPGPERLYPWGDDPPDDTNELAAARSRAFLYQAQQGGRPESTMPVRSETPPGPLPPPHDVPHLIGNAGTWLADGEWPDAIPRDDGTEPMGSMKAEQRLFHGGYWVLGQYPELWHLSYADVAPPGNREPSAGVRCAWRDMPQGAEAPRK